jgi:hypothetical protein
MSESVQVFICLAKYRYPWQEWLEIGLLAFQLVVNYGKSCLLYLFGRLHGYFV